MIKTVTRKYVEDELGIKYRPYSFILKWTDQEDTENIVTLCQKRKRILEIGTLYGHTTENIAKYNPESLITTINITQEYSENLGRGRQAHELLSTSENGMVIRSKNVTKQIIDSDTFFKNNKTLWDAIFIDGDHSRFQIEKDTTNALNHLAVNGILIWHDIYNKDNKCAKCLCEPPFNDVREYLETLPITINKIERSWVGYYEGERESPRF